MKDKSARITMLAAFILALVTVPAWAQDAGSSPQPQVLRNASVNRPVHFDVSPPLRDMIKQATPQLGFHEASPVLRPKLELLKTLAAERQQPGVDPVLQTNAGAKVATIGVNRFGAGNFFGFYVTHAPSDANLAVGDGLKLLVGRIRASVRKRTGGAPPFQLGTPSAVIAVRGTRFDVEVNRRGVTEVDVFEGLVEVGAVGVPGASVLVRPGFSTRVGPGTAPEPPIRTDEIRPDVRAADQAMDVEFLRETAMGSSVLNDNELVERPDSEVDELETESQEAIEGPNDPDHDKPHPPLGAVVHLHRLPLNAARRPAL